MKMKFVTIMAIAFSLAMSISAYAAQWQQDANGWWYENDDGSYPVNQWQEIDGKQYYFNDAGYMLTDTTTPDGYHVGGDGAWIPDVEQKPAEESITVTVPVPQGYGVVQGCITYQYNKFIGTRGDVGAMVYLIPKDFVIKGGNNEELSLLVNTRGKNGVYSAEAAGYGNFTTGNVPTGNYLCMVISSETSSGVWFENRDAWERNVTNLMSPYLTDSEMENFKIMLAFKKYAITDLTIENGAVTTINHDFGYTYL